MADNPASEPWFKNYRRRLRAAVRKLGKVATLDEITQELSSQVVGVKRLSVRAVCEACCLNGSGRHNQHYRRKYDPDYHFLLKVTPGVYALPDPKYLDLAGVYEMHRTR